MLLDLLDADGATLGRGEQPTDDLGPLERLDRPWDLTTVSGTSSTRSKVVKRCSQCEHRRRRRTAAPSAARRESTTLVSSAWHSGQCTGPAYMALRAPPGAGRAADERRRRPGLRRPVTRWAAVGVGRGERRRQRPARQDAGRRRAIRGADHRTSAIVQQSHGATSRGIDNGAEPGRGSARRARRRAPRGRTGPRRAGAGGDDRGHRAPRGAVAARCALVRARRHRRRSAAGRGDVRWRAVVTECSLRSRLSGRGRRTGVWSNGCSQSTRTAFDVNRRREQMFDTQDERAYDVAMAARITTRQRQILDFIERRHARPRLPTVGARDRRGDRADVAVDGAQPPAHAHPPRLPPPRSRQAARHRGALGPQLRRRDGAPAGPPRAARRRRRRRHRRARRRAGRGDLSRSRPTSPARATCSCCGSAANR